MAHVVYRNVVKNFGLDEVIRDISFEIEHKEFVVLLGASGGGKSTLLRVTAGLEALTSGDIAIDGKSLEGVHPRDRDIAMVFQNYALYPQMKVFDNIAFSLQIRRLPRQEIKRKVDWAAEILNISDYLYRYPRELSGGQRQRVAMGRALVREARVFLYDEPLSNLDAKLRANMRYEIRRLHDRLDCTSIYVTHDQVEAMTMADRIVLLAHGKIEQIGPSEDLFERPQSLYVADFIGSPSMNFFRGRTLKAAQGQLVCSVASGGSNLPLPLPKSLSLEEGREIVYGVRPTDMTIAKKEDEAVLNGALIFNKTTGPRRHLQVKCGKHTCLVVVDNIVGKKPGSLLGLAINTQKIHIFDAETEKRLN